MIEVLTVQHYAEDVTQVKRVTLSVPKINAVTASVEDTLVNGLNVRSVSIWFEDGAVMDLMINHSDLSQIERAIGSFMID